jgi:hypothetical protein
MESDSVICSPKIKDAGDMFYTYCKGAAQPTECGATQLDIKSSSTLGTVKVANLPYYTTSTSTGTARQYKACYYRLSVNDFEWKTGAKLNIWVEKASNVKFYMYGGTSRTNRSIAFAVNNASFITGQSASVDAGNGVVILVNPMSGHFTDASFQFSFRVSGSTYPWYEKYFLGPEGSTWLYVAIAVAGFFALILLILLIWGFVACCRRFCCKPKISPDQVQTLSHQPVN